MRIWHSTCRQLKRSISFESLWHIGRWTVQLTGTGMRAYVATVILALTLPVYAAAQPSAPNDIANSSGALSNIRIDNFGRVASTYYRGAQPRGHDYADLRRWASGPSST